LILEYNLAFFAAEGPGGEKTEDATSKKLKDVRNEGNVAKSTEIVTAATLLVLYICIRFAIEYVGGRLINTFQIFFTLIPRYINDGIHTGEFRFLLLEALVNVALTIAPFLLLGFVVAFFSNSLQFKYQVTTKPLMPKFNKLNPINGFKRMFSLNTLVELLKSIVKIIAIGYVSYNVLVEHVEEIFLLYDMSVNQGLLLMYDIILELLLKICIIFAVIAAADFMYQKWKFKEDNKMTKQEVKDEFKNQEGDPKVKGQQRQRMQQASMRRMMAAIPEADVVITNPTQFAVALAYESGRGQAPVVVAKGADFLAGRIKEIAKENSVLCLIPERFTLCV